MTYVSPVGARYLPPPETEHAPSPSSEQTHQPEEPGSARPATTPQQATNAAAAKVVSTQHAVTVAQAAAYNLNGSAASISQARVSLPALKQQLVNAQTALDTAVTDEITSKVGHNASSTQFARAGAQIKARFAHDPTALTAVSKAVSDATTTQSQTQTIVTAAQAKDNPVEAVQALGNGYAHASQSVRTALLQDPAAKQIITNAANWADQPIATENPQIIAQEKMDGQLGLNGNGFMAGGDSFANETIQRLSQLTQGVNGNIGAQVVNAALPTLKSYSRQFPEDAYLLSYQGATNLVNLTSNIQGTPAGNAAINGLASMGTHLFNPDAMTRAIANGASTAYAVALARQPGNPQSQRVLNAALAGVQEFQNKVDGDVSNYAQHMQELNWLIANAGQGMTPKQLNQAISDYTTTQGPAWNQQTTQDEQQVAQDGRSLLQQLEALHSVGSKQIDSQINQVLNDTQANAAINVALQKNPGLTSGSGAGPTLDFFSSMDLTGRGSELAQTVATQYIRNNVIPSLSQLNRNDPASYQQAMDQLNDLKSSPVMKLLGLSPDEINRTITALKTTVPQAGDTVKTETWKLAALKKVLDKLKGPEGVEAGDSGTAAGQVLMGIGLAAAITGFVGDINNDRSDPSAQNIASTFVDAAGLGQQGAALALTRGWVSDDSLIGKFGADEARFLGLTGGDALSIAGSAFTLATAGEQFHDGQPVDGSLSLASGVGGLVATAAETDLLGDALGGVWAGPIGVGIGIAAAVGEALWSHQEAVTQYETPATTAFLQDGKFSLPTAQALTQESGNGYSPVPLLARYAQMKGLNLQNPADQQRFRDWLNKMTPDQLQAVVTAANAAQDTYGGNTSDFKATSSQDNVPFETSPTGVLSRYVGPNTDFHAESEYLMDKLLQYVGAPQL